ncbi:hypothetical protein ACVGOW_24480 [Pseudonocardia saturnea]
MDLGAYVEKVRRELAVAAEAGGDDARALAERLVAPLESTIRLTLLEALAAAADEITRELAPGSVHLRLRGREPDFVVAAAPAAPAGRDAPLPPAAPAVGQSDATDGAMARINFRPPEGLKVRIEEAAGREGLSVNAWLVRAASAALDPGERRDARPARSSAGHLTGWVG